MSALSELQRWYSFHCNGDWENGGGIKIATVEDAGWSLEVYLNGSSLEDRTFQERSYGVGEGTQTSMDEWLTCKVEQKVFKGLGGPGKLEEMIRVFLDWANRNGEQDGPANGSPPIHSG